MRCIAKSKQSGQQCKRHASPGAAVCVMHGSKSPKGPASPTWKDGRHSRVLPRRLLAAAEASLRDPNKLALEDELALIDARVNDILKRVDSGESGQLWRELRQTWRVYETARRAGDTAGAVPGPSSTPDAAALGTSIGGAGFPALSPVA